MQHQCLVLVVVVVLACRLVGVAAAERYIVLNGQRLSLPEIEYLA
jgi:hypothetical protein